MIKMTIFMMFTFVFTILLALLQEMMNIDYQSVTLPQWGPGIAALVLSFTVYKHTLSKSTVFSKFSLLQLLLCLLLPFVFIGISYVVSRMFDLITGDMIQWQSTLLYIVILSSLFGAIGEALGWRTFLQSSADKQSNVLKSSILVGLLWGLWHVGHYSNGFIYMASFLVFTISASLILAILIRKSHYNLLLATMFHLSINLGFYIFFSAYVNDARMIFVNALVWLTIAMATIYYLRANKAKSVVIEQGAKSNGLS